MRMRTRVWNDGGKIAIKKHQVHELDVAELARSISHLTAKNCYSDLRGGELIIVEKFSSGCVAKRAENDQMIFAMSFGDLQRVTKIIILGIEENTTPRMRVEKIIEDENKIILQVFW